MRWQGERQSENIEDRRSMRGGPMLVGGGLGTLILILIVVLLGGDPRPLLQNAARQAAPAQQGQADGPVEETAEEKEQREFVAFVLASTEDVWTALFRKNGDNYVKPTLVLFRGQVTSACGMASAASGPFYCPADQKVYIDLAFYEELKNRFKAPGDFAQAYVVAHEIGHHVQNQLGLTDQVHSAKGRVSDTEYNQLSVRLELQADFFAGVWAYHAEKMRKILEPGDLDEALNAATAIGDDRLQKQAQGYVVPDSFTHGTSEQRKRWFKRGFQSGDMNQGDTFNIDYSEL